MNYKLYIGKISGIKIFIHWTFVLLIAWIVYNDIKAGLETIDILWSVTFVFSIFGCVTLHELGHSLTAQRYHIKTRDITLLPIGGVASLESIPEKPKGRVICGLGGTSSLILLSPLLFCPLCTWPEALEGLGQVGRF
jgi:Zn-dependent protease